MARIRKKKVPVYGGRANALPPMDGQQRQGSAPTRSADINTLDENANSEFNTVVPDNHSRITENLAGQEQAQAVDPIVEKPGEQDASPRALTKEEADEVTNTNEIQKTLPLQQEESKATSKVTSPKESAVSKSKSIKKEPSPFAKS